MHTTWHSLHQGPNISQANSPHLVGSTPQFWSSGRRIIHVSDPDPLWPRTCSVEFMSGLCADQSMSSISCCPRKALLPCAVLGMALPWTYTKFRLKTSVALGSIPSWRSLMWHWRLRVPFSTTISILSWWIALHTMTEGPWLRTLVGCMHLSVPPLACSTHEHDHHSETWSENNRWRHGASSVWGPTFCAFFLTRGYIVRDPKSIWDIWRDASSQKPLPCSELTTSSEICGSSPRTNEQLGWKDVNGYQD